MVVNIAKKYGRINERIDYQKNEHHTKNLLDEKKFEKKLNKKNHQFHLRKFVSDLTPDELVYLLYAKNNNKTFI